MRRTPETAIDKLEEAALRLHRGWYLVGACDFRDDPALEERAIELKDEIFALEKRARFLIARAKDSQVEKSDCAQPALFEDPAFAEE